MSLWNRQRATFRTCLTPAWACFFRKKQHSAPAVWARYFEHFTQAEFQLFCERMERKCRSPQPLVAQNPSRPYPIPLHCYDARRPGWVPSQMEKLTGIERDGVLTVISWNIDASGPDASARARAILSHLEQACEDTPKRTVIMFQEACRASLNAILERPWVQRHFKVSNVAPPESIRDDVAGESFVTERIHWRAVDYFSAMMISHDLPVSNAFRVPFVTKMGRDVLTADILSTGVEEASEQQDVVRVCTTHLESLPKGKAYRQGQLALISALLKHEMQMGQNIIAGLVAGDMNAIDKSEHEYPKAEDVRLQYAWENGPEEEVPRLKPFQRDVTNGQAKGSTWGYQRESGKRDGKRMDKILYTGALEYNPLSCGEQLTRGMRRLGVDLKTAVDAYGHKQNTFSNRRGKITMKVNVKLYSLELVERLRRDGVRFAREPVLITVPAWVSDHYGILAKFQISAL